MPGNFGFFTDRFSTFLSVTSSLPHLCFLTFGAGFAVLSMSSCSMGLHTGQMPSHGMCQAVCCGACPHWEPVEGGHSVLLQFGLCSSELLFSLCFVELGHHLAADLDFV